MAGKPAKPEHVDPSWPTDETSAVSEFSSRLQGALSPFGSKLELPVGPHEINYDHPGPEDKPAAASGN